MSLYIYKLILIFIRHYKFNSYLIYHKLIYQLYTTFIEYIPIKIDSGISTKLIWLESHSKMALEAVCNPDIML
jgi:hypothetical protein